MGSLESTLLALISNWYATTGYAGIVFAMALESCCVPLPSEIVMPLAGLYVAQHPDQFSLLGVVIAGTIGCVVGSAVAYLIGATGGRPLLLRYGRYILISRRDSERADRWFARHGASTAFFSRLIPIIRTYISLPAGISRMHFGQFLVFTALGSVLWSFLLAYLGLRLGPKFLELSSLFHGLDLVVAALLVVAIGLYVYRHVRAERQHHAAGSNDVDAPPQVSKRA